MAADDDRREYRAGPDAAHTFERSMSRILTVSKAELDKREAAYKKSRRAKKTRAARAR